MNTLNKRRSGDENIGKLIVFAITIVIAIGLVGLVSYFYTQSREQAVISGVLGSTASNGADIVALASSLGDAGFTTACTADNIAYDAIANTYTLRAGTTTLDATVSPCDLSGLKGVNISGSGYTLSK